MVLANSKENTTLSQTQMYHLQCMPQGSIPTYTSRIIVPVACFNISYARKCPIHIADDGKKELNEMVSLGVIQPVTEPTDLVSSVAYSQKSNGRCLDPKDLNQAVKRSHHHTPTLEEITHKFKGSTVFSKLDARHGCRSTVLNEEFSYLTTFNSPFGRFRFFTSFWIVCLSKMFSNRR